ncbi:hypothetical protein K469DRAFT_553210 [Zopfia rhizophila CBS 207.26]|uniref:G-protein coupled receptors family 2 profile 2 domain-containing protein n=1 Tax=Zopfia rhizophila CBS 207.26 TaxID=1314779 RepID=A0A6A6EMA1_9PEZI|nr:hypothetical protein K469DRAFT_553210 [Zopfia rhizophila CBS 207.26]
MALTAQQILAVQVSERVMSIMSLLGSLFIVGTFLKWPYFRKPINRLVFYACWGNILANVATLISTSAISHGPDSALCKFQGTLIQWFMMADSLWVFCMALNVMFVFFWNYSSQQLRHLEPWYLLFSYGVPFIPAIVYLMIDRVGKRRILGPATIWCWVASEVEWMRIAFFYGPVWIIIVLTSAIYIFTGRKIFKKRNTLRSFSRRSGEPDRPIINPWTAMNNIERKTDIRVTTETVDTDCTAVSPTTSENGTRGSFSSTRKLSSRGNTTHSIISASPNRHLHIRWPQPAHGSAESSRTLEQESNIAYTVNISANTNTTNEPVMGHARAVSTSTQAVPATRRNAAMDGNKAAWGYAKVAFLMFAALFIVWVPSTVNRVQQFVHKDSPVFGLNLASALVLPLQGFWNAMVYTSTAWPECKRALEGMHSHKKQPRSAKAIDDGDSTHRCQHGNDSEGTLTSSDDLEFEPEVPLSEILSHGPPDSQIQNGSSGPGQVSA